MVLPTVRPPGFSGAGGNPIRFTANRALDQGQGTQHTDFKGDFPMKIRPLHDRVVIKRVENETKTASGIVIPDNAAEKPDQGEVIAVGAGKKADDGKLIAMDVKVGDKVLFGKYSGSTVKLDGVEYLVMREEDIMGVVA
jgi:chaperonin GroES